MITNIMSENHIIITFKNIMMNKQVAKSFVKGNTFVFTDG